MAYLKPPWFTAKIFNKIAMATGISDTETLTVKRRGSGEPQKIPVLTVDVDGTKYLVSTRGESQWVKNMRANPQISIANKKGTTNYVAREIPVGERPPVIAVYKKKGGRVVEGYFEKLPDDADHPTFALTTG
jgi:deazaflavin-dependent oxidoreductase (nitroreductase family)